MFSVMDLELATASYKIVKDLLKVRPSESLTITIDSAGEFRVAEETAKAAEALGAKVLLAYHSTPPGYGKAGDPGLPDGLTAAIPNSDVWVEFNNQWLLYSSPWEKAIGNGRTRYLFLGGLGVDQIIRCIGEIDMEAQTAFQNKIVSMTKKAKKMQIINAAGTDISFLNDNSRPVTNELAADTPGAHFLTGQIGWAPVENSINGVIVFDGSFSGGGKAELGILREPIRLTVKEGKIIDVTGGEEAGFVKEWLVSLNDPGMYNLAHVCYGLNPGAKLSGLCTEDEQVWGCTEWGFGYQSPTLEGALGDAVSHADGTCLNSTVYMDGEKIMEAGEVIHEELASLAKACGR